MPKWKFSTVFCSEMHFCKYEIWFCEWLWFFGGGLPHFCSIFCFDTLSWAMKWVRNYTFFVTMRENIKKEMMGVIEHKLYWQWCVSNIITSNVSINAIDTRLIVKIVRNVEKGWALAADQYHCSMSLQTSRDKFWKPVVERKREFFLYHFHNFGRNFVFATLS